MFGSSPRRRAAWLALALAGAACEIPDFEGPQIQRPPATFRMDPSTHQDRRMFPERDVVHHDAWVEATRGDFSGILIDGHPGRIGRDHVEAARSAAMQAALGRRAEFGEIETLTVDGRTAWGWGERWSLESGEVDFIAFRAVVPYDTISYAIDFLTGDPALEARPDSLRTIVASFAVGATRWNLPLVALVAGAALLLLNAARTRARARADATRRMTLIRMPARAEGADAPPLSEDTVAGQIARQLEARSRRPPGGS